MFVALSSQTDPSGVFKSSVSHPEFDYEQLMRALLGFVWKQRKWKTWPFCRETVIPGQRVCRHAERSGLQRSHERLYPLNPWALKPLLLLHEWSWLPAQSEVFGFCMSRYEQLNITGECVFKKKKKISIPSGAGEQVKNAFLNARFVCNHLLSAATGLKLGARSITHRCEQTAHGN